MPPAWPAAPPGPVPTSSIDIKLKPATVFIERDHLLVLLFISFLLLLIGVKHNVEQRANQNRQNQILPSLLFVSEIMHLLVVRKARWRIISPPLPFARIFQIRAEADEHDGQTPRAKALLQPLDIGQHCGLYALEVPFSCPGHKTLENLCEGIIRPRKVTLGINN